MGACVAEVQLNTNYATANRQKREPYTGNIYTGMTRLIRSHLSSRFAMN